MSKKKHQPEYEPCSACGWWSWDSESKSCENENCPSNLPEAGQSQPAAQPKPQAQPSPAQSPPRAASPSAGPQSPAQTSMAASAGKKLQPQFDLKLDGPAPGRGSVKTDPSRLLAAPLGGQLLGVEVTADIYGRNGFRLIGAPACAGHLLLEGAAQRFRNLFKINPEAAIRSSIQTGYDAHLRLDKDDLTECLARLNNPRQRMLYELFWPHLSEDLFAPIKSARRLNAASTLEALTETTLTRNGREGALAAHALAVVYHNQAIAHELAFAAGEADWSDEYWSHALGYWAAVIGADDFWDYLRGRVAGFDDPRVKPDDVLTLRAQLPAVILGFHTMLAGVYSKVEAADASADACRRHLTFIRQCGLPEAAKQEALKATVKLLAAAGLGPLNRRADEKLLAGDNKIAYRAFRDRCDPLIGEAFDVRHYLASDLKLPEAVVAVAEFDGFCDRVVRGLDRKINYDNDERLRAILYAILMTKRLLGLPVSSDMRRRLERAIRNDSEIVYRGIQPASHTDPSRCWFMEGEDADPEASIELPVYKVTDRHVEVNYLQGSAGVRVSYEMRRVLIPRSARAKASHEGRLKAEDVKEESLDAEGKRLFAQVRSAEAKCEAAVEQETKAAEAEVSQEEAALGAALAQYDRSVAAQKEADEKHLAAIQDRCDQQAKDEQQRGHRAAAEAGQRAAPLIAKAQAAHAEVVERNRGLRGGKHLETPAMAAAAAVCGIGGLAIGFWGAAATLAGAPFTTALGGVALGLIIGLIIGRAVRISRVMAAKRVVAAAQRSRERAIAKVTDDTQQAIKRLQEQAAKDGAEARKRMDTISAERERRRAESKKRQAEIRKKHEQASDKIRKAAEAEIKAVKQRLIDRMRSKPKSAEREFPAYVKAKQLGYKDGSEPSSSEMEMTYSERQDAIRRLGGSPW